MAFNFSGKKILVTGAGRGIGRAISKGLAKSGCKVYALSRTKASLDSLVKEYPSIVPITQDIKDWDETRAVLEGIETLDGLVNNAGIENGLGPALDCPKEHFDKIMQVNLYGAINCIQVVAKKMVEAKRPGSIVNISSITSAYSITGTLDYNVSKAALDMVTKQFALELGPHNIRVNSVNPSFTMTGEFNIPPEDKEPFLERSPLPGLPTGEDVANCALYLLSDYSAMVTGTLNFIDGGLTCNITKKQ